MHLPCSTHNCLHPPRRLSRPSGYYYSITVVIIVVTVSLDCSCADHLGSDVAAAMSSIAVIAVDDAASDKLELFAISFGRCFVRRSFDPSHHLPLRSHQSRRASTSATAAGD